MAEPLRTREARRLAERALVWLLWELRETRTRPIVLGGLVPDVLAAARSRVPHLGTTDVDLLIEIELDDLAALDGVERSLRAAGFEPDATQRGGWRWWTRVEGAPVKLEFLCDRDDQPRDTAITAGGSLGVLNLRGAGYVTRDHQTRPLRGTLRNGRDVEVQARFAGLCGYLLTKLAAVRERDLDRDSYDLVYVLLNNQSGGPRGAARALRESIFATELARLGGVVAEVRARFADPGQHGPQSYAKETRRVDSGLDARVLAQDAVAAVGGFLDELAVR